MIRVRLIRFFVGIDQAFNPLVYGGSEDVTISAQTAYNELFLGRHERRRKAIDWFFRTFFGEKNHCYDSLRVEADEFPNTAEIIAALGAKGIK